MAFSWGQEALAVLSGGAVGFSLGLIGGGGSILAVPLLLYVVGIGDPHVAIGTSALSVAANAFANLLGHWRAGAKFPGDAAVDRVSRGNFLVAGRFEHGAEDPEAAGQQAVARQGGLAVAAGEMHRAVVAAGRVVERVLGDDREGETSARRGSAGGENRKMRGRAAVTSIVLLAPVMLLVVVSVAVIVWSPAVFSMPAKKPTPLVKAASLGSPARLSLLVKCTVPL